MTCPCLPPDKAPEFAERLQGGLQLRPGHLLGRGLRRGERLPRRHRGRQVRVRATCWPSSKSYDQQGVTKQIKFDANGEPAEVSVWAYKVDGRQDRPGPGDQVSTDWQPPATGSDADRGPGGATGRSRPASHLASARCRGGRPQRRSDGFLLIRPLLRTDHHRSDARRDLRPGRPRLHPGLRRAAADQLRPLRGLHVRHASPLLWVAHAARRPVTATGCRPRSVLLRAGHRWRRDDRLRRSSRWRSSGSPTGRCANATPRR